MAGVAQLRRSLSVADIPIQTVPTSHTVSETTTAVVFLSLGWVAVLLRLWTRAVVIRSLGGDDITMGISMVFFTVFCSVTIATAAVVNGEGILSVDKISPAINGVLVIEAFYVLTMLVLKISLAIFFLRIMVKPWQRRTVYVAVTLSTLFNTGYFFFAIFQCGIPTSASVFLVRRLTRQCVSPIQILGVSYTHAAVTMATDLTFAALPVSILRQSIMKRREKWIIGFILILGAVGGLASIIRIKYVKALASTSLAFFTEVEAITIWSTIEPGLGIIAGSLATLRPLFRSLLKLSKSPRQSVMGSRSPWNTEKTGSGRQKSAPSICDDEIAFFDHELSETEHTDGVAQPKKPWRPGGRQQTTNLPPPPPLIGDGRSVETGLDATRIVEVYE